MKRLFAKLFSFFSLWVANTTSFPSSYSTMPAGMVADKAANFGIFANQQTGNYDSSSLLAIANGAATTLTLTALQFFNNCLDISGSPSSGLAVTTPTAALIIAAVPNWAPQGGFNFPLTVMNDATGQTITFTAGANVTLSATTATIANNTSRNFTVNVNVNAGTVTIVGTGGGATL